MTAMDAFEQARRTTVRRLLMDWAFMCGVLTAAVVAAAWAVG